jgi:hypothetical protein
MMFSQGMNHLHESAVAKEVGSAKRQRISIDDVEHEMKVAGLCQPVLSLLSEAVAEEEREVRKRRQQSEEHSSRKRQRTCSQLSISAQVGPERVSALIPYTREQRSQLAKRHKITFESSDFALEAELPEGLRPMMKFPCGQCAKVAKAALDHKGVAYLWGEDGELLAWMPPIKHGHYLTDGMPITLVSSSAGNPTTDLQCSPDTCTTQADWEKSCKIEEVDEFSPSTTVPDDSQDDDMCTD